MAEESLSQIGITSSGGYFEFPVHQSCHCGFMYVPENAVALPTLLQVITRSSDDENQIAPLLEIKPQTQCSFFSKPVLIMMSLRETEYNASKITSTQNTLPQNVPVENTLLMNPLSCKRSSENQPTPWVDLGVKSDHDPMKCTSSPWWQISDGYLYVFLKYCGRFKLVRDTAREEGVQSNVHFAAASVFIRNVTSRKLDCTVVFHCRHVDLDRLEAEQASLGRRVITKSVLIQDKQCYVVVQGKFASPQWKFVSNGSIKDKSDRKRMQTHLIDFWDFENLCRHPKGYPQVTFHAQLPKAQEADVPAANGGGSAPQQRLSEDFTLQVFISQNEVPYCTDFQVTVPCEGMRAIREESVTSTNCINCRQARDFIPRELHNDLSRYLQKYGDQSRAVRSTTNQKLAMRLQGNHVTDADNILSFLEIKRCYELLKLCVDEILAQFDEGIRSLILKYEKLILPIQHYEKIGKLVKAGGPILTFLEENSLLPKTINAETARADRDNPSAVLRVLSDVLPFMSEEQFTDFKQFLNGQLPSVAVVLGYNGFYEDMDGNVVSKPGHPKGNVKFEVRRSLGRSDEAEFTA